MANAAVYRLVALLVFLSLEIRGSSSSPGKRSLKLDGLGSIFDYSATISVGQNEPIPFSSKFHIKGKLILLAKDNGKYSILKFQDMKHTMYNGQNDGDIHDKYQALDDSLKDLEQPFMITYTDFGFEGIKISEQESIWSKNLKKSIVSTMQMQISSNLLQINEKTIYGNCTVQYVPLAGRSNNKTLMISKVFEPKSCSNYVVQSVSDGKRMDCKTEKEEDLVTSSETIFELSLDEGKAVPLLFPIKITSHEKSSYLPWLHRSSGIQNVEIIQTLELDKFSADSELKLPVRVDFDKVEAMNDLTFIKDDYEKSIYVQKGIKQDDLSSKVKEYLIMMVDYMKDNQFNSTKDDSQHNNVIKNLLRTMTHLNNDTMYDIYNKFNADSEKELMARNIFLKLVPHTGTEAAWNFTFKIINENKINNEYQAINMLSNLPMFVINPTENFAKMMVGFRQLSGDNIPQTVKNTAVLTYSILLHKTYKGIKKTTPEFLKEQLEYFNTRLQGDSSYESKIIFIMAMRNVEVGNIYEYLAPIIKGEYKFQVKENISNSDKYRIAAVWAVAKSIAYNRDLTYNLFWPILSNSNESLSIRLAVYEQLIPRNPLLDMNLLMNVHWLMVNEKDEHMFNYHYSTLKSMAESKDSCMQSVSEAMRKVLRLTKPRKILSNSLSRVNVLDYEDEKYGYGMAFKFGVEVNEATGMPQNGFFESIKNLSRKPKMSGLYWNIAGINLKTVINFFKKIIQMKTDNVMQEQTFYEIPDEKVKNLLKQTYGYKLLDKNIHLEFWMMSEGYITNVKVFFDNSLSKFLQNSIDQYKSTNLMDIGEMFNFNWLDISYLNHYKMIVPTSIGFPALFYNEAPQIINIKLKPDVHLFKTIIIMKIEFEARYYHQSSYEMVVYNPLSCVTHSIERRADTDISYPLDMTIGFNLETKNIKMVLSRMPFTRFSTGGFKTYAVDKVKIEYDYSNKLENHCPTCKHTTKIAKNPNNNEKYEKIYHSLDTGLEYTFSVFQCEYDRKYILLEELIRVLRTPINDENGDLWPKLQLQLKHAIFNFMNVLYTTSCGTMFKIAPCQNHPTSHIEMDWRFKVDKLANGLQFNVRGTLDTKEHSTNNTVRFWNLDVDAELSQFFSDFKVDLTRNTMQEQNLKICFQSHKEYSNFINKNLPENHREKFETLTKMHFTMGYTDRDDCVGDSMMVNGVIRGEPLDEQIEQIKKNVKPGACFRNKENPLDLDITQRFDWNCLYEAVKATTMRKYTYDFAYQKIPSEILTKLYLIDDFIRYETFPRVSYSTNHTEPGYLKAIITYSMKENNANITVMNPFYSYNLVDVQYGSEDPDDKGNDLILDNTGFTTGFLVDYYKGDIRPCIAHSNDVITDLNETIPMSFKDWTLMSGDYGLLTYAVFVKAVENNQMSVKIYACTHVLEIRPGTSKPVVTLNDVIVNDYEKGVLLPALNKHFKIMMVNQLLVVETEKYSKVKVYYTPNNVVVLPHTASLRTIDGVCGHMGSTAYIQKVPLLYGSV